ncbi:MAG: hypothetical protein JRN30_06855, partial [Nitrososphaerota archaeon]|nr:hypothetical protein [Nitrososphaerota archaeon]
PAAEHTAACPRLKEERLFYPSLGSFRLPVTLRLWPPGFQAWRTAQVATVTRAASLPPVTP